MVNPFDVIIERLDGLESKISQNVSVSPLPEIIGRDELCKRLNITQPTCIRWERKGKIPRIEIGSAIRYNWPKVIEALESKQGG